jgi:hypothetical protein
MDISARDVTIDFFRAEHLLRPLFLTNGDFPQRIGTERSLLFHAPRTAALIGPSDADQVGA